MVNQFQDIVQKMRAQLPGALATGIFSINDGLMLAVDSGVPDTNVDAMSASHTRTWDKLNTFLKLLPDEIVGDMNGLVLEVEGYSFYISVDRGYQIAVMAACDTKAGNLGLLRVVTKRYMNKVLLTLSNL